MVDRPLSKWAREEARLEVEIKAAHKRTRQVCGAERLQHDLAEHGIRVNCISPGGIMTPIFFGGHQSHDAAENQRLLDRMAKFYVQSTPVGRAGWPDDIAYAALFLASDESTYVTGQNLVVEGGRHTLGRSAAEHRKRLADRNMALYGKE